MSNEQSYQERAEHARRKPQLRRRMPKRSKSASKQSEWYAKAKDQIAITSGASGRITLGVGRGDSDYD